MLAPSCEESEEHHFAAIAGEQGLFSAWFDDGEFRRFAGQEWNRQHYRSKQDKRADPFHLVPRFRRAEKADEPFAQRILSL